MARWLVIYYDGNQNRAKVVNDTRLEMPFGNLRLAEALGDPENAIQAIIGPVDEPDQNLTVVIDDQEVIPEEIEL